MFGYLRPYKEELKVKELRKYKKSYCAVCYGLRKKFGFIYSSVLNYEIVFLYIFLESVCRVEDKEQIKIRCSINPLRKIDISINKDLIEYVSFINYYLMLVKLKDNYNDEHLKIYKVFTYFFERNKKYKNEVIKYKELVERISKQYDILYRLENSKKYQFDECSKTMGKILHAIVAFYLEKSTVIGDKKYILELSSNLGKWIYLIDAYDDFEDDYDKGRYNPLNEFVYIEKDMSLKSGEMILKMMSFQMKKILKNIYFYENEEMVRNIIVYGTESALARISNKKKKL